MPKNVKTLILKIESHIIGNAECHKFWRINNYQKYLILILLQWLKLSVAQSVINPDQYSIKMSSIIKKNLSYISNGLDLQVYC